MNSLKKYGWLMPLSFGLTCFFFYNGGQNINLVMTQMADALCLSTAALCVLSSALFWCYAFGQLYSEKVSKTGPMIRVNFTNNTFGTPNVRTVFCALLQDGQFVVWDSSNRTMRKIGRHEIAQSDVLFSVWATVQQRITVVYR